MSLADITDLSVFEDKRMVFNTRPSDRGQALTETLQTSDAYYVVQMPLLNLVPRELSSQEIQMFYRWLAGDYDVLVVVSPTSAQLGLERCIQIHDFVPSQPVIAVGETTATVLREADWQVHCPDTANNEGMLMMPVIKQLQAGDRVLIWRGVGGRKLLIDNLQQRGVQVDIIEYYERQFPPSAYDIYQRWIELLDMADAVITLPVMIISSTMAFEHWCQVVDKIGRLTRQDFIYVVLGQRLAQLLHQQGLNHIVVENLQPETILNVINHIPRDKMILY